MVLRLGFGNRMRARVPHADGRGLVLISPLYLPYISPIPPLYLPCISLYLPISPLAELHGEARRGDGGTVAARGGRATGGGLLLLQPRQRRRLRRAGGEGERRGVGGADEVCVGQVEPRLFVHAAVHVCGAVAQCAVRCVRGARVCAVSAELSRARLPSTRMRMLHGYNAGGCMRARVHVRWAEPRLHARLVGEAAGRQMEQGPAVGGERGLQRLGSGLGSG